MNYSVETSFENQSALPISKQTMVLVLKAFHLNEIYHEIRGNVQFFKTDRIKSTTFFSFHKPQYVEMVNILFETSFARVSRNTFWSIFTTTFSIKIIIGLNTRLLTVSITSYGLFSPWRRLSWSGGFSSLLQSIVVSGEVVDPRD